MLKAILNFVLKRTLNGLEKSQSFRAWLSTDPDLTGVFKLQRQVEKDKGILRLLEAA